MAQEQRHYVKYTFYKVAPEWRRLPQMERREGARAFLDAVEAFSDEMMVHAYNLQGMRGDADFLLWQVTSNLETIQELAVRLANTGMGAYLSIPYSYLAMTKQSPYMAQHRHAGQGQEGTGLKITVRGAKYLFIYPFWKTRPWYRLAPEERQAMMNKHFEVGHKYPSVKINTAYSFGLDDQEFVVAFETDKPGDFLDLVMELRGTEASLYTLRDTPIFTCIARDLKDILASLEG